MTERVTVDELRKAHLDLVLHMKLAKGGVAYIYRATEYPRLTVHRSREKAGALMRQTFKVDGVEVRNLEAVAAVLNGEAIPTDEFYELWCCQCQVTVSARLTNGAEVYPHRPDLAQVPRWKCDGCGNHVGTHRETSNPTRPLGNIPTPEIARARRFIHALIDPAWQSGKVGRKAIYAHLSAAIGREYHTGEIRTIEEARTVYAAARAFLKSPALATMEKCK